MLFNLCESIIHFSVIIFFIAVCVLDGAVELVCQISVWEMSLPNLLSDNQFDTNINVH